MMKKLSVLLFCLLIAACIPKGEKGGTCLEGKTCSNPDLVCNADNHCEACGQEDQRCCSQGEKCFGSDMICSEGGLCLSCGNSESEPCCSDGSCLGDLYCDSNNWCSECGSYMDPCCSGSKCNEYYACNSENNCDFCGSNGQLCCPGNPPSCTIGACNPKGMCVSEVCDTSGKCTACGNSYLPCCEGGFCDTDSVCSEGDCVSCGGPDQPVCQDGNCIGWMRPYNGVCGVPFDHGEKVGLSVCEALEPGHGTRNTRDWCIWYVAFDQQNTSLCAGIAWSEMIPTCEKGEDPRDYYMMPVFKP